WGPGFDSTWSDTWTSGSASDDHYVYHQEWSSATYANGTQTSAESGSSHTWGNRSSYATHHSHSASSSSGPGAVLSLTSDSTSSSLGSGSGSSSGTSGSGSGSSSSSDWSSS